MSSPNKSTIENEKPMVIPSAPLAANPMLSAVYLFLDDIRMPINAFEYTQEKIFVEKEWIVVRNYNEFVSHILNRGLPKFISFDHDLSFEHYAECVSNGMSKRQARKEPKEKTGHECAKWLVDYCILNNLKFPEYYCHSMNPVGKENIVGLLRSFSNRR